MPGKWRWLAVVAVAFPQIAFASAGSASAPLMQMRDGITELRVTGGAAKSHGVKGEADLNLQLGPVTATLSGTAHASRVPTSSNGNSALSGGQLSVDTVWHHHMATLDLKASQHFQNHVQDGSVDGALYVTHATQQSDDQTASATATMHPLPAVSVALGAEAQDTATAQRQSFGGAAPTRSRVETRSDRAFAKASWQPLPAVKLEAEATTLSTTMMLRGNMQGHTDYQATEPHVTLSLKPWSGGDLTLGVEQSLSPLSAANLAAYAAATGRPTDAALKPDSARSLDVALQQHFGQGLSLTASYSNAELDSTTVLMPAISGQTPVSIAGGRRQSFHAALTLSLAALGLPRTSLTSKAMWQRSRIRDPLTGRMRRVSGEAPHEASLRLAQTLPTHHLTWGLEGRLGSDTRYYQAAQETTVSQAGSFGAFVEYDPGPFTLSLNVAGLAGGSTQTDTYYAGSRASNRIDSFGHSTRSSTTVGLSLTKSLDG